MEASVDRNVSVQVLRAETRFLLSSLLNPVMVIKTERNRFRHWSGLAGLCQITPTMEARIAENKDPTNETLRLWSDQDPEGATINQLLLYLEDMDRFDVKDDLVDKIDEDIIFSRNNPTPSKPASLELDNNILCTDDINRIRAGESLQIFDGFVLYDHEDIDFATQLITEMEQNHGVKLFVRDRDLIGGGLEYGHMVKLITERCNRIIVILSNAFFRSSANAFYLSFGQAYGVHLGRKIIPIMYLDCNVPPDIRLLSVMDYRKTGPNGLNGENFWVKLKKSLAVPVENQPAPVLQPRVQPPQHVATKVKISDIPLIPPAENIKKKTGWSIPSRLRTYFPIKMLTKHSSKEEGKEKKGGLNTKYTKQKTKAVAT